MPTTNRGWNTFKSRFEPYSTKIYVITLENTTNPHKKINSLRILHSLTTIVVVVYF